jgi:hypothetical protein
MHTQVISCAFVTHSLAQTGEVRHGLKIERHEEASIFRGGVLLSPLMSVQHTALGGIIHRGLSGVDIYTYGECVCLFHAWGLVPEVGRARKSGVGLNLT